MGELGVSPRTIDDRQAQQIGKLRRRTSILWKTAARAGREDGINARALVRPGENNDNAVVVKVPTFDWGKGPYGTGQAFMVLRDDYPEAPGGGTNNFEPDKNVMFRVDRRGAVGTAGGIHVATGLRFGSDTPLPTQGIWVDPIVDSVGIVIDAANDAPAQPWLLARTNSGSSLFQLYGVGWIGSYSINSGTFQTFTIGRGSGNDEAAFGVGATTHQIAPGSAAGDAFLRSQSETQRLLFGAGLNDLWSAYQLANACVLGHVNDGGQFALAHYDTGRTDINASSATKISFQSAGTEKALIDSGGMKLFTKLEMVEIAAPTNAPLNGGYLYLQDNGSGKTQLRVRFNTGAAIVIATEP